MKTLIIGGTGYIGSYLAPMLVGAGRKVTTLSRSTKFPDAQSNNITNLTGDFSDKKLIKELVCEHDDVIHLAYATVPNTSFDDPLSDLLHNLPPTLQLYSEVAKKGSRLILLSSGGTVYGDAVNLPIAESHPTNPISPYGVTKLTLEKYAYLFARTHGLKFICARPANAYGEGQRPSMGQGFISTALASVLNSKPIDIYGENGTIRDYIHVRDVAAGISSMLEYGKVYETYNIGSGLGRSNADVVDVIRKIMNPIGYDVQVRKLPERLFDVKANVLNSDKLINHTGWAPSVELEDGVLKTLNWLKLNYA